jgi:uncharacterized membrane protein YcaP (DUF421 family)
VANDVILPDSLRKAEMVQDELRQMLRRAGVRRYDVVAAVPEHTGTISRLRHGKRSPSNWPTFQATTCSPRS